MMVQIGKIEKEDRRRRDEKEIEDKYVWSGSEFGILERNKQVFESS